MSTLSRIVIAAVTSGICGQVVAQPRCDCTTIVGACSAEIELTASAIEISTSQAQCARVDYFVDGLPFVAVARDGRAVAARVGQTSASGANATDVFVQSCQICSTAGPSTVAVVPEPAAPAPAGPLTPIVSIDPEYPVAAERQGIEGYVDVEFVVTAPGTVEQVRVAGAAPSGVFDMAAVSAVSRWRYAADAGREPQTLRERISFDLDERVFSAPLTAASLGRSASAVSNVCVRELLSYNFGDFIEVSLFNSCNEPLTVFACGQGTGSYQGRWVCTDSEKLQQVLVNPDDTRLGTRMTVSTPQGPRPYLSTDEINVTRAPNSEYWWIACAVEDLDCRRSARSWLAGVDRQSASVNPQIRSELPVSRSY